MLAKKTGVLLVSLMLANTGMYGVVAQYTKQDKKKFEELTDVSFTKSALASKARKDKRVEDLRQLDALIVRRLINILDGAGLKKDFKTSELLKIVSSAVIESTEKPELFAATRFATYDFEKKFENSMEAIFQAKLKTLENQPLGKTFNDPKAMLAIYKTKIKGPFTLLAFENRASLETINKKLPQTYRDSVTRLKRILSPTKEETIKVFKESLPLLDQNYKKVVTAIKNITKSQTDALPESLTYFLLPS